MEMLLGVAFFRSLWHRLAKVVMRWRVLFLVSLAVNCALAAWILWPRPEPIQNAALRSVQPAAPLVKTNVVLRRQFFSWDQVESPDYATYVANLRAIGCPEQTIRDIIIADVNAVYARRLATELVTPEQQWWRSEPDTNVVRTAVEQADAIDDERRALLTQLLGAGWEGGDLVNLPRPSRQGVLLDGPVLGHLPDDLKQAVEEVSARSGDRIQALLDQQREQGIPVDPAVLAGLRRATREELSRLLTPPQLEEYLLRYSQNANDLRAELGRLKHFNASPEEFRALFRATDSLDQRIAELAGRNDPNSVRHLRTLEQQRTTVIRNTLGAERFREYVLLHDPAYQAAVESARAAGSPEAAQAIYQVNLATAEEEANARANTNLTPQQLAVRLKEIERDQLAASTLAAGQEVPVETPPPPPVADTPRVSAHPYVLGVGDTVGGVAMRYNVSIDEIRAANPDVDFRNLKAGDSILVPDLLKMQY
jgi:hypothetical protein